MHSFSRSLLCKASQILLILGGMLLIAASPSLAQDETASPPPAAQSYTFEREYAVPSVVAPMPEAIPTKVEEYAAPESGGPLYFASAGAPKTRKLFRGIHNVLFGWIEIPKTIMMDTVFIDPFTGFFSGLVNGTARTVERTGVGALEIVTFWHEWPYEYQPIIMPEYVWGDLTD